MLARLLLAIIAAILISLSLFTLMHFLINQQQTLSKPEQSIHKVAIKRAEQKTEKQTKKSEALPDISQAIAPLPSINSVNIKVDDIALPELKSAELSFENQEQNLDAIQNNWLQPAAGAGAGGQDYLGEADTGIKEIVPISTATPYVPKIAWDNKISGWVLLAFEVKPDGTIGKVRVMDASPRGVFEPYAVDALKGWRYTPFNGSSKFLSQKIEFNWQDYPNNIREFGQ